MNVAADRCVVPLEIGTSVAEYVAACVWILEEAGLEIQLHAYVTNIEGEWEAVFVPIKRCHEMLHPMGAPRNSTNLRVGTRTYRDESMQDKITSVQKILEQKTA